MSNIKFTDQLECTASHGRLAVTSQIYDASLSKTQEEINRATRCHVELGSFERSRLAEDAAADPSISGNAEVAVIHYIVTEKNRSGVILQQVGATKTTQILILDETIYVRYINFTSNERTEVLNKSPWYNSFVNNLEYNETSHVLRLLFTNMPVTSATLPLAAAPTDANKAGTDGLISGTVLGSILSRLDDIEKKLTAASD